MKRILIDLTDLELWAGQHGGTQRVVYGIAKNFYLQRDELGYEVCFVAFSARDKLFYETDFAPIYERVEALKQAASQPASSGGVSLKTRLKYRLRPYVPESVRRNPKARKLAVTSARYGVRVLKAARAKQQQYRTHHVEGKRLQLIRFQPTDTVLMLGKPWDNPDIQRRLTEQRGRHGFRLVQLVYDMIIPLNPQLHHPSLFKPYTQHMFEAISASDLLLPISKSTERDVKTFCKRLALPVPPMKVIRLGDEVIDTAIEGLAKPDPRIAGEFIACVGTIEIRKNHMLLYYAYKRAAELGIELPQLVIVGSRGWLSGDFQYLAEHDPHLKGKIIILDNINDAALGWVYGNCLFTVYPSMYEGWGLPVAESLARHKLCIASDASSIPEIAGDLIDYFSPYDPADCLQVLQRYLDKPTLEKKELQIAATYVPHSWQDTYRQVLMAL
ncbi:MAG: glycosyltransferase family 1 protein [Candidatus Saccharibacteria bacterium]